MISVVKFTWKHRRTVITVTTWAIGAGIWVYSQVEERRPGTQADRRARWAFTAASSAVAREPAMARVVRVSADFSDAPAGTRFEAAIGK